MAKRDILLEMWSLCRLGEIIANLPPSPETESGYSIQMLFPPVVPFVTATGGSLDRNGRDGLN